MDKREKTFLKLILLLLPFYIASVIFYIKLDPHLPVGHAAIYALPPFLFVLVIFLLQITGMFFFKKK